MNPKVVVQGLLQQVMVGPERRQAQAGHSCGGCDTVGGISFGSLREAGHHHRHRRRRNAGLSCTTRRRRDITAIKPHCSVVTKMGNVDQPIIRLRYLTFLP